MSGEFGRAFFAIGTAVVLSIVWFGYYRNVYVKWISWFTAGILVAYMTVFLSYRYFTDHMAEHVNSEPNYALIASIHGTISLWAIVQACVMFFFAARVYERGENYFKLRSKSSLLLALLWPLSLLSGMLL